MQQNKILECDQKASYRATSYQQTALALHPSLDGSSWHWRHLSGFRRTKSFVLVNQVASAASARSPECFDGEAEGSDLHRSLFWCKGQPLNTAFRNKSKERTTSVSQTHRLPTPYQYRKQLWMLLSTRPKAQKFQTWWCHICSKELPFHLRVLNS